MNETIKELEAKIKQYTNAATDYRGAAATALDNAKWCEGRVAGFRRQIAELREE